jgi:spore germination cell wall hydrolase CwlJ-like protein
MFLSNSAVYATLESQKEQRCLTEALYHEARGEVDEGIVAVKKVILNRVLDPRWPNTVCGVVYQPYQFSYANEEIPKITDWSSYHRVKAIAEVPYNSIDSSYKATHYLNPKKADPSWTSKLEFVGTIGNHDFYK